MTPAERGSGAPPQELASAIAHRQFGVLTRQQLLECGLSPTAVDRWAALGRLQRLYPGVFALGHRVLTTPGRRLAAVLACGLDAGMSFTDSGAVWNVCRSSGTRFHVTVPHGSAKAGRRPGIHVHVTRLPLEIVVRDGIPVTTLAQTLRDMASIQSDDQVAEAVDAAFRLSLFDQVAIDAVCGPGRAGSTRLQRVIALRHPQSHHTRSGWEAKMLRLLDAHHLPRPLVNQRIDRLKIEPDLLWPREHVVVEWDSWLHHSTRDRFEADRHKTITLQNAGYTVLRFTWDQTTHEPEFVAGSIRTALSRGGASEPR